MHRQCPKHTAVPNGFSMIELLVVVSFIAILASIAIQRFPQVREKAHDAAVKSDLQNAYKAEENYFVENNGYVGFSVTSGGTAAELEFKASPGVSVTATVTDDDKLQLVGTHDANPSKSWCLSTVSTKIVEASTC